MTSNCRRTAPGNATRNLRVVRWQPTRKDGWGSGNIECYPSPTSEPFEAVYGAYPSRILRISPQIRIGTIPMINLNGVARLWDPSAREKDMS